MPYKVHNASRDIWSRGLRAANPTHKGLKQYIGGKRIVRGRPATLRDEELEKLLPELRQREAQGLLYVTTMDGRDVDLSTLAPAAPAPIPALPNMAIDDAAKDKVTGVPMPLFPGETAPPADFEMPVPAPHAAIETPVEDPAVAQDPAKVVVEEAVEEPSAEEPAVEEKQEEAVEEPAATEPAPAADAAPAQSKSHQKKHKRS